MSQKIPTAGRIVLAVIRTQHGELQTRPAIITRNWGNNTPAVQGSSALQLTVFPDVSNDGLGYSHGLSSALYDETGKLENTWHWPPTV